MQKRQLRAPSAPFSPGPRRTSLTKRANAHGQNWGNFGAFSPIVASGLALFLALTAASCGDSQAHSGQGEENSEQNSAATAGSQDSPEVSTASPGTLTDAQAISPDVQSVVDEIIRLSTPLDPTLTSDHHDRQFKAWRELTDRLIEEPDHEVGIASLQNYITYEGEYAGVRRSLLTTAAYGAPEESRELLTHMMLTYGFRKMDDRTEATLLLAKTSPETFLEAAKEMIARRGRATKTMPDDEWFVRGWVAACELTGRSPVPELADVVTNLAMTDIARAFAAEALGDYSDVLGRIALETTLVESSGNGYLRRKSAQALLKSVPAEDVCALLKRVFMNESDTNMSRFLKNMIESNCN